jgi:hypothetical protein
MAFPKIGWIFLSGDIMTHIRDEGTSQQRRRARTTLMLAAASGGLPAAAMAGSPAARADDPFTDIASYVHSSITAAEGDFSDAGTDFSTAGDANEGLVALYAGIDILLISPTDYTLLGLTAAATNTDYSNYGGTLLIPDTTDSASLTAAGQEAIASSDMTLGQEEFSAAESLLTSGDYFSALDYALVAGYDDMLASEANTVAALFSAGF